MNEPLIHLTDGESALKPNGSANGGLPASQRELRALATSVLLERMQFMRQHGLSFDGARDEYAVLGYDRIVTVQQYREEYARGGIAGRIVDCYPNATWRGLMEPIEDENPDVMTELETAWDKLETRLQIQAKLQRVDKLSQLSTFAVLLIGAPGELADELPKARKPEDLLYLQPFIGGGGTSKHRATASMDSDCTVFEYETDASNPRFGQPKFYQLKRTDFTSPIYARPVHHTRIIHIAENLLEDEVHGQPRLERVWNLLCDLRKVTGGGAEAFWLRANQGMHIDVDKDMTEDEAKFSIEVLREQQERYKHQLDRWLKTKGTEVDILGSDVANFESPADAIITQISGALGIPKRILTGSEMGELASSQDRDNWRDQVNGRQTQYAGPYIVRPLIDRLIKYGYLPPPTKGPEAYEVRWPMIVTMTEGEKIASAKSMADVNSAYGDIVFTNSEIRERCDKAPLTDEQKTEIETEAKAKQEREPKPEPPPFMQPGAEDEDEDEVPEELKAAQEGPHEFSTTQIQVPESLRQQIYSYGQTIPEEALDPEKRVETDLHITVRYGLHTQDAELIKPLVEDFGVVDFTLGKTAVFSLPEHDVLYVEVRSLDLELLNRRLAQLAHTQTTPRYIPHLTVAYLRPGEGAKYVGDTRFEGYEGQADEVVFSTKDDTRVAIDTDSTIRVYGDIDEQMISVLSEAIKADNQEVIFAITGRTLGGPGSGNFGHAGRPGQIGGSATSAFAGLPYVPPTISGLRPPVSVDQPDLVDPLEKIDRKWESVARGQSFRPYTSVDERDFIDLLVDADEKIMDSIASMFDLGEAAVAKLKEKIRERTRTLGSATSGNYGHAGRPGQVGGSTSGGQRADALRTYHRLSSEWAKANTELKSMQAFPYSVEAREQVLKMAELNKQIMSLDADPGGIEGVGLPGDPRDVVIVGAGPAGLSAAARAGYGGLDTLIVDQSERPGGQAKESGGIENLPGYEIGTPGQPLYDEMGRQTARLGVEREYGVRVTGMRHDSETGLHTVQLSDGREIQTRTVILAGGITPRRDKFQGSTRNNTYHQDDVRGLYKIAETNPVVIAGGGNGAGQAAIEAARRGNLVTIVSRKPLDAQMDRSPRMSIENHPNIKHEIGEIESIGGGEVTLKGSGKKIPGQAVGVFFGGPPDTDWLKESGVELDEKRQVKIDPGTGRTKVPGVFAAGDITNLTDAKGISASIGGGGIAAASLWKYFDEIERRTKGKS